MDHFRFAMALMLTVTALPLSAAVISNADIEFTQVYSIAPDRPLSPSWDSYVANMRDGLSSTGFNDAGDPATPAHFSTVSGNAYLQQVVVTDATGPGLVHPVSRRFNSWLGQADPGTVYGAAFAGEYGSRIHAPLLVVATDGPIRIDSMSYEAFSTAQNGGGAPLFDGSWSTFSDRSVGVTDFGTDGMLGGGDDVYVTSGNMADADILAFASAGLGIAFQMSQQLDGTRWPDTLADADIFEAYKSQWGTLLWDYRVDYTVNYTKSASSSSLRLNGDPVLISAIPEPPTAAIAAVCALLLMLWHRGRHAWPVGV